MNKSSIMQKKHFQHIVIISIVVFSLVSINMNIDSNINLNHNESNENALNVNAFTKDNYTEILTTNKHSLGNISIDDIRFNSWQTGLVNENAYHPLIVDDHFSGALSIDTTKISFIEATNPALSNYLDSEAININTAMDMANSICSVIAVLLKVYCWEGS